MVDDLLAVMDAAGSERAVVFASTFAGYLGAHFAASHPDRTVGLILESPLVATHQTEETPWVSPRSGTSRSSRPSAPTGAAGDGRERRASVRWRRSGTRDGSVRP
jgi:pimeloyl-ACP methyl ester carboxylesterase